MILADTSAWVEFDRATGSPVDLRLTELVDSDDGVGVTEPVLMEVVAGATDELNAARLRRLLKRQRLLPFVPTVDFDGAVKVFRRCRAAGFTPRGFVDCMIASVASRHGAAVLAQDRDFAAIARVMHLRLDDASLR
ncbi:MAG: PIN domain nuclease [Actinobacteria bacterium]|nr:PIN domain nuclease [Actinomycetota bacterium]